MKKTASLTDNTEQVKEILVNDFDIVTHQKCALTLTLEQRLTAFDPETHVGEVMTSGRIGAEIF